MPAAAPPTPRAPTCAAALLAAALLVAAGPAACVPGAVPGGGTPAAGGTPGRPVTASPAASDNRPFRPTPAPSPTFAAYVVRRGDTLLGLARRFGTTTESLAYWNRAAYPSLDPDSPAYDPNRIDAGWTLVYLPGVVVDPENLPPAPSAAASPGTATAEPFPTLPANGSAALVPHGPRGGAGVALTFELAGPMKGADAVVRWLAASGVPVTVFVEGSLVASDDPAVDSALARLAVAPATLVLGSLGWDLRDPSGLPPAAVAEGLSRTEEAIVAATGRTTVPFYRPATGTATPALLAAVGPAGWPWAIGWDVDPGDEVDEAAGGPSAEDIVALVRATARSGSIVRLHLGGPQTLDALPGIVEGLAADGHPVVALTELLGISPAP